MKNGKTWALNEVLTSEALAPGKLEQYQLDEINRIIKQAFGRTRTKKVRE